MNRWPLLWPRVSWGFVLLFTSLPEGGAVCYVVCFSFFQVIGRLFRSEPVLQAWSTIHGLGMVTKVKSCNYWCKLSIFFRVTQHENKAKRKSVRSLFFVGGTQIKRISVTKQRSELVEVGGSDDGLLLQADAFGAVCLNLALLPKAKFTCLF